MSEAKVSEWHVNRWGSVVREFVIGGPAAVASNSDWSAFRGQYPANYPPRCGHAAILVDAMAKADAQLREWGLL